MTWVEIVLLMLISCIATPFGIDEMFRIFKVPTMEKDKLATLKAGTILSCWLIILFIASCLNQWMWCQYVFGLMLITRSLIGITGVIINEHKVLRGMSIVEFVFAIGVGCYLIYIIPNHDVRNIVLQITSSICGGLITLVGVSWTIIAGRKEQTIMQKNQIKPIIYSIDPMSGQYNSNDLERIDINHSFEPQKKTFIGIVHNTDNGIFIIKQAKINNNQYKFRRDVILRKNMPVEIVAYLEQNVIVKTCSLIGTDIQNNKIEYELILIKDENEKYKIDYIIEK